MRPIVIHCAGARSNTAAKIVELLNAAGAKAYYNEPPTHNASKAVVINWSLGSSKYHELYRLHAAGVPTPRYSMDPVPGWLPRRQYHAEAKDFTNPPRIGDFYTEPVFTNHEFRVHVLHDSASGEYYPFRTQYKYLPEGTKSLVYKGVPIRNHVLGWRFDPGPQRRFPETTLALIRAAGLSSVRALGYDMGAVDIGLIVGSNGFIPDRSIVFEVNTRPSMDEYTRDAYVHALLTIAGR